MKMISLNRLMIAAVAGIFILAGCSAKPETATQQPSSAGAAPAAAPQKGNMPPQMSQEAARVSAEANAQAAARSAAANQQPR